MKEYPEVHQQGTILLHNISMCFPEGITSDSAMTQGDLGIQVAKDGRIWVCINGIAFVRFSPHKNGKMGK